jgi:hypothetical protein
MESQQDENPLDEPFVMITGLDQGKPRQEVIATGNKTVM